VGAGGGRGAAKPSLSSKTYITLNPWEHSKSV